VAPFRPLASLSARWRPHEGVGLEHLDVRRDGQRIVADSVVIGDRAGVSYGARYRVICDAAWVTRSLDIETTAGRALHIRSDGAGHWLDVDNHPLPHLDGCIDIDLAASPFTNTLPIRRAGLKPRGRAKEFRMAYVPFDTLVPNVDAQRYRCLETGLYRYEAVDGSFVAELTVDDDGLVVDYPPLFRRVTA
jgi:hypothetical protein